MTPPLRRAVRPITKAERRAFAKQIEGLIKGTGKLEKERVDAVLDLLNRARADIQAEILELPPGKFSRRAAIGIKDSLERRMREFEGVATELMTRTHEDFADAGNEFMGQVAKSQGKVVPRIEVSRELLDNVATRSADLIRTLSRNQIGKASEIINRSVITGKSIFQTGRELSRTFDITRGRAEVIARQEMLGTYSQVQQAHLDEEMRLEPKVKKTWITVQDLRARTGHLAAHMQTVPANKPFKVAPEVGERKENLIRPRDPAGSARNVIGCRCTMIADYSDVEPPVIGPLLTPEDLPPVQAPLKGVGARVAKQMKKTRRRL